MAEDQIPAYQHFVALGRHYCPGGRIRAGRTDAGVHALGQVVTFDDAKTSVEALQKATANAGYPSTPKP